MTKRKRHALIWVGSIFGIIAIATAIFISTLDQNKAKKYISAGVSKATGRQLTINGDLDVDLGWISRVRASQIQFENAQWSKHPQMVEVGLFDVQIDLWQLLSEFRVVLPKTCGIRSNHTLCRSTSVWEKSKQKSTAISPTHWR